MPFRFSMQKVLDYREQLEDEAKVRLGKAENDLREGQARFDAIKEELQKAEIQAAGKVMTSGERWLHDQYLKGLRKDIEEAAMRLRTLRQIVEEARKYLAERAIDKKLLDKYKDRKRKEYQRAELKQEQNFNDEIATVRHKTQAI